MYRNSTALRLTAVAREYCELIESLSGESEAELFVARLDQLLPRLHAVMAVIGDVENVVGFGDDVDLERRFDLYCHLRRVLGDRDPYWMEFDMARDNHEKSGSLADDLNDIYWALKGGLNHLGKDADLAAMLRSWGAGYRLNWGQHLVDAERQLYALRSRRVV